MRLLLIEDDELLGDAVKAGLTQFGYVVDWLKDGESARAALRAESFELVILDLSLPKLSGLSLLKSIRQAGNTESETVPPTLPPSALRRSYRPPAARHRRSLSPY